MGLLLKLDNNFPGFITVLSSEAALYEIEKRFYDGSDSAGHI